MREILFRGKRIDNGEWVYGWAFGDKAKSIIEIDKEYPNEYGVEAYYTSVVIPETVGQYTGLKDRKGKKIFEGDIVKGEDHYNYRLPFNGTVGFKDGSFVIIGEAVTHYRWMDYSVEIIGNIHEEVQE